MRSLPEKRLFLSIIPPSSPEPSMEGDGDGEGDGERVENIEKSAPVEREEDSCEGDEKNEERIIEDEDWLVSEGEGEREDSTKELFLM